MIFWFVLGLFAVWLVFINVCDYYDDQIEEYSLCYDGGVVAERGFRKNGKREGLCERFHEDGSRWERATYVRGLRHGQCELWGTDNYQGRYHYLYGERRGECMEVRNGEKRRWVAT